MKQIPWTFTFPFDNGDSKSVTGYTPLPEKGTDYFTAADQEAIVQQAIAALQTPVFGRVDANNNIILTGELGDGTYTFKYEDAEGNLVEIGTMTQSGEVPYEYINQIPISTAADGSVYNSTGYKNEYRLNTSGAETAASGMGTTGFIPCKPGDILYMSGIATKGANSIGWYKLQFYNESKTSIGLAYFYNNDGSQKFIGNTANLNAGYVEQDGNGYLTKITLAVYDSAAGTGIQANSGTIDSSFRYVRIVSGTLSSASVATVNQPILADASGLKLSLKLGKIDTSTGSVSTSENYIYSDLISIEGGKAYTLVCNGICAGYKICYYDANKNFLSASAENIIQCGDSGVLGSGACAVPIVSNAAYFRLRGYCFFYGSGYADGVAATIAGTTLLANGS